MREVGDLSEAEGRSCQRCHRVGRSSESHRCCQDGGNDRATARSLLLECVGVGSQGGAPGFQRDPVHGSHLVSVFEVDAHGRGFLSEMGDIPGVRCSMRARRRESGHQGQPASVRKAPPAA